MCGYKKELNEKVSRDLGSEFTAIIAQRYSTVAIAGMVNLIINS